MMSEFDYSGNVYLGVLLCRGMIGMVVCGGVAEGDEATPMI